MDHPILLYDGVCGLCNYFVQFVLRRDRDGVFRFAWLQGETAGRILERHGVSASALDTVYVVVNFESPDERLLARSDAVGFVLQRFNLPWRAAAVLLGIVPGFLRDTVYNAVARRRYRFFGRFEVCMLPRDIDHSRFLDG